MVPALVRPGENPTTAVTGHPNLPQEVSRPVATKLLPPVLGPALAAVDPAELDRPRRLTGSLRAWDCVDVCCTMSAVEVRSALVDGQS